MTETWRPVVGWEDQYMVSDQGRVYSRGFENLIRSNGIRLGRRPRILRPSLERRWNRHTVTLVKDGRQTKRLVHYLVLEAFVGPRPEGMEALHWDDDQTNNQLSNLRWGTHAENTLDKVRNGKHYNANKTHCNHGHQFTIENTYIDGQGRRNCRTCCRDKMRRIRARRKAMSNG